MNRDGTGTPSIRQSKAKKVRQKADDPALSEPPIVPIEPTIPGEISIPDWIVQDILQRYNQLSSQREKRLLYYRAVI